MIKIPSTTTGGKASRTISEMERDCRMGEEWTLEEYEKKEVDQNELDEETAKFLLDNFSSEVEVRFPNLKRNDKWELINQGFVGYIALPGDNAIVLKPKVELGNVFAMMEYAYGLGEFDFSTVYDSESVEGFYDRIANILAENVIDRRRRGLYRSYVEKEEETQRIKGRIDFTRTLKKPWDPKAHIKYSEMTADNEDNQILFYTLNRISSASSLCRDGTLRKARRGIRSMKGGITYNEFRASDCTGKSYNRLNSDYERLHALCRLILDNSGPSYEVGKKQMVPFNVDMADLFQEFVTEWLRQNLLERFRVKREEEVTLTEYDHSRDLKYRIDIVLYDREVGEVVCVIDTKYKAHERPETGDISQMVGYAKAKDTEETLLLYPEDLNEALDVQLDDVHVQNITFELGNDLQKNGEDFVEDLADALSMPELKI
jgi:5-methylcytosine-specific restriction enzyme subunit McrC